jgi:hypothetical protein
MVCVGVNRVLCPTYVISGVIDSHDIVLIHKIILEKDCSTNLLGLDSVARQTRGWEPLSLKCRL